MDMEQAHQRAAESLRRSMEAVSGYFSTAMHEVALEIGGEELAERVAAAAVSDNALPNPAALQLLESVQAGSAKAVTKRTAEIQDEQHARERTALLETRPRSWGRLMLEGAASVMDIASFTGLGKRRRNQLPK